MSAPPLLILFGAESGNSEDLASIAEKQAKSLGLSPSVKGMEEIEIGDLVGAQNVLIFCSTWGEGEMPDNAVDLWEAANGDSPPSLSACNYAVCALGDTSYEFLFQSGTDWDDRFEKHGATRLLDRVDRDVEQDAPPAEFTTNALTLIASAGAGAGTPPEAETSAESDDPSEETGSDEAQDEAVSGDLDGLISSGDRSLVILFGSQSGNSEDLAAKISKDAKSYGLVGAVPAMDGFDLNSLSGMRRVLIICSPWGEGAMPDHAEDLWQVAISDSAPRL